MDAFGEAAKVISDLVDGQVGDYLHVFGTDIEELGRSSLTLRQWTLQKVVLSMASRRQCPHPVVLCV
jgi:hypothetical protein